MGLHNYLTRQTYMTRSEIRAYFKERRKALNDAQTETVNSVKENFKAKKAEITAKHALECSDEIVEQSGIYDDTVKELVESHVTALADLDAEQKAATPTATVPVTVNPTAKATRKLLTTVMFLPGVSLLPTSTPEEVVNAAKTVEVLNKNTAKKVARQIGELEALLLATPVES